MFKLGSKARWTGRAAGAVVALAVVFTVALSGQASAFSILRYEDYNVGTSAVDGALGLLSLTATTAADTDDFNTLLGGGGWDLVIFGEQNYSTTFTSVATALTNYVNGGGRVLGTSWRNEGFIALMEADLVDQDVQPIVSDGHPLFDGVVSPVTLYDPGWGIWSQSYDPLGSAVGIGTLGSASAVILGNDCRTLLYGPLFDTYANLSQGQQFVANGIDLLLNCPPKPPVPEPASIALLGIGVGGMVLRRIRRGNA